MSTEDVVSLTPTEASNIQENNERVINSSKGATKLRSWLNKFLRIQMTDGRVLIGSFLCTDRDANVILASCSEYLSSDSSGSSEEPRLLGLVMVPGKHIVSVHIDFSGSLNSPLTKNVNFDEHCK